SRHEVHAGVHADEGEGLRLAAERIGLGARGVQGCRALVRRGLSVRDGPTLMRMPRRRSGVLLPIEETVLEIGLRRLRDGDAEFHGFAIARELDSSDGRHLTAHGTLYKALDRLERGGLLVSRWEDPDEYDGSRPRRRLYRVSDKASAALVASRAAQRATLPARPGLAAR